MPVPKAMPTQSQSAISTMSSMWLAMPYPQLRMKSSLMMSYDALSAVVLLYWQYPLKEVRSGNAHVRQSLLSGPRQLP